LTLVMLVVGCHHGPPADFAPDPGLVQQIREIRIDAPPSACPGAAFPVTYTAVLTDGALVPFESRYDKKHPPPLHVIFLQRSSPEATPLENGAWVADRDPMRSVRSGFHLTVGLLQRPSLRATATLEPEYSCLPHAFGFEGVTGDRGQTGEDGPDVTVRLAIVRSPFYERLLVAGIEVANAPPFYTVADANAVAPRDWLILESRGGRGGRGVKGESGVQGGAGAPGCPGGVGGAGGPGGRGGIGGQGGRGGRITIIAPTEVPFLSGLVDARSPGGRGGEAGPGGDGGKGGDGGPARAEGGADCKAGARGPAGAQGGGGVAGREGTDGPRPQVITVPTRDVFGGRLPF
jgi:hypothetical protein